MLTILFIIVIVSSIMLRWEKWKEGRKQDSTEAESTEPESEEPESVEPENVEADSIEPESKEAESTEPENKEAESKEADSIEPENVDTERQQLSGKVVYQDEKRKLYFAEDGMTPMVDYEGNTYSLGCHPYEPMLIIRNSGADIAYVHNAFYPDEAYKDLLNGRLVNTITGKNHNAERFARLLTTAIDTRLDDIRLVERGMMEDLALHKGVENIEYATYDFHRTKMLYEGVAVLLGYFDVYNYSRPSPKVYALAFGYPHDGTEMYEYYLITREEYLDYMQWGKTREWKSHEEAYAWHEANLAGRQVLCNEFSHMKKSYKPFFRLSELHLEVRTAKRLLHIPYTRTSVCAQDDYVNRDWTIKIEDDKTLADLMALIRGYHDDTGFAAIPYTGGNAWWHIKSGNDTLAEISDADEEAIRYNRSPSTPLSQLGLHELQGVRKS